MSAMQTDFCLYKQDETQYWTKDVTREAVKVYAVYLINRNSCTYCCEITPSYEATILYYYTDEHVSDEVDELIRDATDQGEVSYFHVGGFTDHDFTVLSPCNSEYKTEEEYRELMEEVIEGERCNPTFC